jgi:hypothetical protein
MPTVSGFLPSTNGFHFSNFFEAVPLTTIDVGVAKVPIGNAANGLCGGMVFATRDMFEAGMTPPPDPSPPSSGPLFDYLVSRLMASFMLPGGPLLYLHLMNPDLPDHETTFSQIFGPRGRAWVMINEQWPRIKADLDAGRLSPIALVQVKSHDPFQMGNNHQVLAYGYDLVGSELTIKIYDPNYADADNVAISLNLADPKHSTEVRRTHGDGPIYCFFAVNYAFVAPPPFGQSELGDLLHVAGASSVGNLWHSLRYANGGWQEFRDVEAAAGDRGFIVDCDVQSVGTDVHLCAVDALGRLWHTIRGATNGRWAPFGDVEGQTGDRGSFRRVGIADVRGELHVCGTTNDGRLWHTIRPPTGSWTPFGDIEGQTGDRGVIADVDCAGVNGELHVCAVNSNGQLWHTIRTATGWTPFGDVEGQTGDRGVIREVACAEVAGELHVCAVNSNGQLWHAIRTATGWTPFGDVEGQTGDRGVITRVSLGGLGSDLYISAVSSDGRLWHAVRRPTGWTAFADLELAAGDRGAFTTVSVDGLRR